MNRIDRRDSERIFVSNPSTRPGFSLANDSEILPILNNPVNPVKIEKRRHEQPYSHSMVLGGLLEISKQTRLTPLTSLIIREEILPRIS